MIGAEHIMDHFSRVAGTRVNDGDEASRAMADCERLGVDATQLAATARYFGDKLIETIQSSPDLPLDLPGWFGAAFCSGFLAGLDVERER